MYPFLARFGLEDQVWLAPAMFGAFLLVSLLSAWVFHKLIFRLVLHLSQWTRSDQASRMMRATRWPLTLAILDLGAYLAVTLTLGVPEAADTVDQSHGATPQQGDQLDVDHLLGVRR